MGSPSLVLPSVWVGSAADASDAHFMAAITHVLCCAAEFQARRYPAHVTWHKLALTDNAERGAEALLREGANKLREWRAVPGATILVHCALGRSRSVSTVAAYLVLHEGTTAEDAVALVRAARTVALPYHGFVGILEDFERSRSRSPAWLSNDDNSGRRTRSSRRAAGLPRPTAAAAVPLPSTSPHKTPHP